MKTTGLIDPHPVESLSWALLLLAGSGVSECGTLLLAYMVGFIKSFQ
jgi:hypothetical protein